MGILAWNDTLQDVCTMEAGPKHVAEHSHDGPCKYLLCHILSWGGASEHTTAPAAPSQSTAHRLCPRAPSDSLPQPTSTLLSCMEWKRWQVMRHSLLDASHSAGKALKLMQSTTDSTSSQDYSLPGLIIVGNCRVKQQG